MGTSKREAGYGASADPRSGQSAGERWTAEALGDLRADRFRPAAWRRFVGASLERSAQTRTARPGIARQARRWCAAGAAGWLLACLAVRRSGAAIRPAPGLIWWLATWRMLDWHLGMAESPDGAARPRLSAADAVTMARLWLVPLLPSARRSRRLFPALVVAGGLSDCLDGALARRRGSTRLGRDLDTAADVCFLSAAAVSARAAERLPVAAVRCLLARHALGVGFAVTRTFASGRRPQLGRRPSGAVLRVAGLAVAAGGGRRVGSALLIAGCLAPPAQPQGGYATGVTARVLGAGA